MHDVGTFSESWAGLLAAKGYSHPVGCVELVVTHVSWVLLTGEFAYKIKRPVQFEFVDMRAVGQRKHFCEEEVRLNRRFAPDIYLEVCPIVLDGAEVRIGGDGVVVDYAVRMRQFERNEELDRLLAAGRIEPVELERFGIAFADIHAGLPVDDKCVSPPEARRVRKGIVQNLHETARAAAAFGASEDIQRLKGPLLQRLQNVRSWLNARRELRRVRECHGDLHVRNVVRRGTGLVAFDCMEFEPSFRWIDVAEDIALLLADLESRGYTNHAHAFLSGYLARSGDYQACRVLGLYKAHRALVRAKICALTAATGVDAAHLALCSSEFSQLICCVRNCLKDRRPIVLMMCGLSGSGKTWLGAQLAQRLELIHLSSDVERKRGASLATSSVVYTPESTEKVYGGLARDTEHVLSGGYGAVLDATFSRRDRRARLMTLCGKLGVQAWVIHCSAPLETLRERIAQRRRLTTDPSDADEAVLDWQRAQFEPIGPEEGVSVLPADTTDDGVVTRIEAIVRRSTDASSRSIRTST